MNKNDLHKIDFSVRSDLSVSELQSWNEHKEESGKYLLASLLEIHLSFQHYRCETFANYFNHSLGSSLHLSSPQSVVLDSERKSRSKHYAQFVQSLPTSPLEEVASLSETSKLLPRSKHTIRFSSKDFHVFISKIARFKRLNLEAASSKLSCFQSRSKKRIQRLELSPVNSSEQFVSDSNEEETLIKIKSEFTSSSPPLYDRKGKVLFDGIDSNSICEGPTECDKSKNISQSIEVVREGLSIQSVCY